MKTVVIYYTLSGNCALVAQEIKSKLNADSIRLQTKDEKKRSKIGTMFWGGAMVLFHKKPPLKPYTFDPSAYDLIVIGAPVWASSVAPPMQTFISQAGISGKKIALFVCHLGGKEGSLEQFKSLLAGNEIVAETDFKDVAKNGGENLEKQVAEWVEKFKG